MQRDLTRSPFLVGEALRDFAWRVKRGLHTMLFRTYRPRLDWAILKIQNRYVIKFDFKNDLFTRRMLQLSCEPLSKPWCIHFSESQARYSWNSRKNTQALKIVSPSSSQVWKVKTVIGTADSRPTRQANIKLPCLKHRRWFIEPYKLSSRFFLFTFATQPTQHIFSSKGRIGRSRIRTLVWISPPVPFKYGYSFTRQKRTIIYGIETKLNNCKIWGAHNLDNKIGHSFVHLRFLNLFRPLVEFIFNN